MNYGRDHWRTIDIALSHACLGLMALVPALTTTRDARVMGAQPEAASKPNVLFIAVDDLNDWIGCLGGPISYGTVAAGKRLRQSTRPGAVWLITDSADKPLGHFVVDDRTAQAVIPQE